MANNKQEAKGLIQTYEHEKEIEWKQWEPGDMGHVENPRVPHAHTPPGAQEVPTNPDPQAVAPAATRWACEFCLISPHIMTIILYCYIFTMYSK